MWASNKRDEGKINQGEGGGVYHLTDLVVVNKKFDKMGENEMGYAYRVVQVPPRIQVSKKDYQGGEAAAYMESVINEHAAQGWEFFRVDQLGVQVNPGCLGALLGQKASELLYYVITFRRQKLN